MPSQIEDRYTEAIRDLEDQLDGYDDQFEWGDALNWIWASVDAAEQSGAAVRLFQFMGPDGYSPMQDNGKMCGCLVQVASGKSEAWTPEWTERIRNDPLIPNDILDFDPKVHATHFADLQREFDRDIRIPRMESGDGSL